jgi:hypothetical protein
MDNQNRLTYLTRYYYALQGVRFAPLWGTFLCLFLYLRVFAMNSEALSAGALWTLLLGLLALQVLWYWMAKRYYRRRFGWLKPDPLRFVKKRPQGPIFYIVWLIFLAWMIYCRVIHSSEFFPYLLALLLCQPVLDVENPRIRRICYGLGCGLIVASALSNRIAHLDGTLYIVTLFAVMLALGIADHLLLLSLMTPPNEDADA